MTGPLRSELLAGIRVIVAGDPAPGLTDRLRALGAEVIRFEPELDETGEGGAAWVADHPGAAALVFDARPAWRAATAGIDALRASLDAAWVACAAAANGWFIPSGDGGRIVLIGPGAQAGELAAAATDGLENLARTLSIEWARFGITITAIAPSRPSEAEDDLATIVAFLLSRAGGYFTGSRLDVGGLRA
jgi:NAD(P)-dependent dehydrogenase (short-subunit alcohol dehydrogenase family)